MKLNPTLYSQCDIAKAALKGKFRAINAATRRKYSSEINRLSPCFKGPRGQEQTKVKINR